MESGEPFVDISLPHDAMISEDRRADNQSGVNACWFGGYDYEYVKRFTLPKEFKGKVLTLEFEGVYRNAEVYLNGKLLAYRPYGYTNFYVPITDRVRFGEQNELRVIARNADQPNSRWYSGAGIYRPVNLWVADRRHVAMNGVRVRTLSIRPAVVELAEANEYREGILVQVPALLEYAHEPGRVHAGLLAQVAIAGERVVLLAFGKPVLQEIAVFKVFEYVNHAHNLPK